MNISHIRADATNSSVWRRKPLYVTELKTAFLPSDKAHTCTSLMDVQSGLIRDRILADIIPVQGKTPEATHAMISKQVRSLGALTPADAVSAAREGELNIFLSTTDCGGDQVGADERFAAECAECTMVWHMRNPCWKHQHSLDAKESIVRADKLMKLLWGSRFGFFSVLAMTMNVWRAFYGRFWDAWVNISKERGNNNANTYCEKVPPRCVGTRWDSASQCMDHLPLTQDEVYNEFVEVVRVATATKKTKAKEVDASGDPHLEEQQQWRKTYGRWSLCVIDGLTESSQAFRRMALIMRRGRGPWDHFTGVLSKRTKVGEPRPLAKLVWGKADTIAQ